MFRVLNRKGLAAINASVRIEVDGQMQFRDLIPNQGYCSSNDPRLHFGLGNSGKVGHVTVRWQKGVEEAFGPFEAGRLYTIQEGTGRPSQGVFSF